MRDLIKQVLENEFNADEFSIFIKNLFNEIAINPQDISIAGNFAQHIKGFKFLGEYKDTESKRLDILIVELVGDTKVSRARIMQRNLIAKYLKDNLCDAALVAFYSQQSPDWRLSFVKMEYKLTDKGAKVEVGTPPKRYSFLVGKTEPSHTASSQLLPILEEQKVDPLVSLIEDAFSIEKVTKEFFVKYKQLFTGLEQQLENNHTFKNEAVKNNINAANFAKKLLGQIVFLYFLQKKGWLGVPKGETWGNGDKHFLRHIFDKCLENSENFFNNYLEFLFYDTLNNPRNDQADRNYSARFKCKIPFLNGGLFEPEYDWQNSFIYLDNSIFADIFDVFDLYNFTVKEDEPLEKEVAVDPEMLGKVFENLLEENLRKGKGTYYTPREIVHYMCQESLANYIATDVKVATEDVRLLIRHMADDLSDLPTSITKHAESIDKALANIKVVDPACGSGAFCVGMLQEIVKARLLLNPSLLEYRTKKETIQNCIYGVDIDPGAIEIAKLRLWLSLVVDYDLEDIEPLPNLDYKIMQGNSLLEVLVLGEQTIKLFDSAAIGIKNVKHLNLFEQDNRLSLFDHDETTREIFDKYHKWQVKLFNAKTIDKKKEARENLKNIESELIEETVNSELERLESVNKNIGHYVKAGIGLTEQDAKKKMEVLSLQSRIKDVLNEIKNTGNRPYFLWHLYFGDVFLEKEGFDIVIANPPYIFSRGNLSQEQKDIFKKSYSLTQFKLNLYILFIEKSFKLLNNNGAFSFIVPNNWLTLSTTSDLRHFILTETFDTKIVLNYEQVFQSASVDTCLLIFKKSGDKSISSYSWSKDGIVLMNQNDPGFFLKKKGYLLSNLGLFSNKNQALIDRIDGLSEELGSICEVKNGVQAYTVGEGTPIQTTEIKGKRAYHSKVQYDNAWLKYLDGLDVCRYWVGWSGQYIKYGNNLSRPRQPYLFDGERLVVRQIPSIPPYCILASYITEKAVVDNNCMVIKTIKAQNLKYILALLNSRLTSFWFIHTFGKLQRRTFPQFKVNELRIFPIKNVNSEKQKPFIEIVNKILAITKASDYLENPTKKEEVKEYENQIDKLVYKLYNLTPEEIKIVESSQS